MKYLFEGLLIILAGIYFYSLPNSQLLAYHFSQFCLFLSISLLFCLVCFKDCIKEDDLFWHFHITLFSRINITALYAFVILGGSSAALKAIDTLFKTKLLEHQEIRIVILTLWIFLPLFFLAGVPRLINKENLLQYKPLWIKNISIYVLIPFTTIYLAILYAYMGKIALQWKLPEGMVSYLVLSFAAFGITSLVIGFPFQKDENSKWTYWFGRFFYFLQLPLLVLLGIAIYQRVMDYGITFRRYYVLLLAVWLLLITIFMIIRKNKNLIAIPLTLLILALLSSFGPWSAFNVAFLNQKARLDRVLNENGLIISGKLSKPNNIIPNKVKDDICSITKYLFDYGKLNVYSGMSSHRDSLTPKAFVDQLGFEYKARWGKDYEDNEWFNYSFGKAGSTTYGITSDSLDALIKMNIQELNQDQEYKIHLNGIDADYDADKQVFIFKTTDDSTFISLNQVIAEFGKVNSKTKVDLYVHQSDKTKIICLFNRLSGNRNPEGLNINSIDVDFLIKSKK